MSACIGIHMPCPLMFLLTRPLLCFSLISLTFLRKLLLNRLEQEPNCRVLFIESICTDPVVLAHNLTMKLSSPDYKDMDERQAREDFRKRLENYERAYQTLGEDDEEDGIQYCKLINVGKKVTTPTSNWRQRYCDYLQEIWKPWLGDLISILLWCALQGHCIQHPGISGGTMYLLLDEL